MTLAEIKLLPDDAPRRVTVQVEHNRALEDPAL